MHKYFKDNFRVLFIGGDNELDQFRDGLIIQVLPKTLGMTLRDGIRHTLISITNIMVENSDNGTPRVSAVMFPGQSHISRGMTVLMWA